MEVVSSFMETNMQSIVLIGGFLLLVSLIWNIILSTQLSGLNKKYKRFMKGSSGKNIESMIIEHIEDLKSNDEKFNIAHARMDSIQEQMDRCIQKHSIIRYNAFNDTGSDLSYSIALMDNFNNGLTLTGIYGRNEFIGYAKPIDNGNSTYPLSVEEQLAISRCQKKRINNKE